MTKTKFTKSLAFRTMLRLFVIVTVVSLIAAEIIGVSTFIQLTSQWHEYTSEAVLKGTALSAASLQDMDKYTKTGKVDTNYENLFLNLLLINDDYELQRCDVFVPHEDHITYLISTADKETGESLNKEAPYYGEEKEYVSKVMAERFETEADLERAAKENIYTENVKDGVAAFKKADADSIVAIGGGSSMDTAKAIGIIITNPEFADVRSLEGVAPTKNHAVFTIAVPTTAGTAAEVTINYVITDVEKKRKFVCVDTNDIPEIAVVDPDMMSSMPKGLTAATGMDALTHAIEGYITKGHCTISDMFHLEAIRLISRNLRAAVQNDPDGREGMALGQYIAGMGFSNVGLGIVHSMAHGLSALYDTPHGVACAILLPCGLEYNASVAGKRYRAIGEAMGVEGIDAMDDEAAAKATIAAVKKLSADVGIPANLKGILKEEDITFLSESAFADACCPGNPRDTSVEEIKALYRSMM